jgi:hypothetical protein
MKNKREVIYVACPYWHRKSSVKTFRVIAASLVTSTLISEGFVALSPLTHSSMLQLNTEITKPEDVWRSHGLALLERCDRVLVVCMDGWKESEGVKLETELALALHIPVTFYYPSDTMLAVAYRLHRSGVLLFHTFWVSVAVSIISTILLLTT